MDDSQHSHPDEIEASAQPQPDEIEASARPQPDEIEADDTAPLPPPAPPHPNRRPRAQAQYQELLEKMLVFSRDLFAIVGVFVGASFQEVISKKLKESGRFNILFYILIYMIIFLFGISFHTLAINNRNFKISWIMSIVISAITFLITSLWKLKYGGFSLLAWYGSLAIAFLVCYLENRAKTRAVNPIP